MKKCVLGFTLIELMFAIVVLAILVAIAAPNFSDTLKANRVQSLSRELFSELNYARSEAVSRRHTILFCHSNDAATCSGTWNDGWIICLANSTKDNCDTSSSNYVLRVYNDIGTNTLSVMDNATTPTAHDYIGFSPNGYASLNNPPDYFTLKICDGSNNVKHARAILITGVGQILDSSQDTATGIYKDVSGGDLTCP